MRPACWCVDGWARLALITLQSRGSEMSCTDRMAMVAR